MKAPPRSKGYVPRRIGFVWIPMGLDADAMIAIAKRHGGDYLRIKKPGVYRDKSV